MVYKIMNEDGEVFFVDLDEHQEKFFFWLDNRGFLAGDILYQPSGIPEIKKF